MQVDPYLVIGDDFQVYVKPQAEMRNYGSLTDNQQATSFLFELRDKLHDLDKVIQEVLVQNLSNVTEVHNLSLPSQSS